LIIDSDAHIGEPADLWVSRLGQNDAKQVPHVERNETKGRLEWFIGDESISLAPSGTVAGYRLPPPSSPKTFEEAHPAAFDAHARLELMDRAGIWAQVLFPNVGGFGNDAFLKIADEGLRLDCVRAYNDFLAEWISPAPERFVAVCAVPFWDTEKSIEEIERSLKLGHKAILFSGKPDVYWGQAALADPVWDPIWNAAVEADVPVAFHVGGADPTAGWKHRGYKGMPDRTRFTANVVTNFFGNAQTIADLIFGGVLQRFPSLKVASVETGIGWIPFLLECMDYQFLEHHVRERSPELELMPSEYFRRQIYSSFWFEYSAPQRLLDVVGVDRVMFETDFPHPTSIWPETRMHEQLELALAGIPADVAERVTWRNAAELYGVQAPPAATVKSALVAS
jgi:predicted TIM-barrel fold metal-dependent hydrolase